ncbi:DUF2281 domain-containing protein [Tissierella sp.]|uniref:DUF2281 domain-containing protein n=1 Tax=Tissierella sp. TaxID=41274 RepID=UPI00304E59F8
MLASEKLIKIAKTMSEDVLIEIVDFAENLINNMTKEQVKLIDEFIDENEVALRELSK